MILHLKPSIFIDIWKLHFSIFYNRQMKNVIIRFGLRTFPGSFIRISTQDPIDQAHKKAVDIATTLYKLEHLPKDVRKQFQGMTKEQQVMAVKRYEQELDPKIHDDIQAFVIEERKKGTSVREIKRMVSKKYKVNIL